MTNVNAQIQDIIKKRNAMMDRICPEQEKWEKNSKCVGELERDVKALRRSLEDAINNGKDQKKDDGSEGDLSALLTKLKSQFVDIVSELDNKCKRAKEKLKKLEERCNRKTLNISVAGVGRSGKSTALKSLLNLDQSDNNIIPSNDGPAVTAGKSILVSVPSKDMEKTEVEFHSEESFMTQVVEPYLNVIFSGDSSCSDLDDFLTLDLEECRRQLAEEQNPDANQTKMTYLDKLSDIQKNIRLVKDKLNSMPKTIPLNETGKYVSYQQDEPNVCYAVKQVKIYCVFPNNEIESLQLIDLPGLGTCSESERRCFTDGFSYAVDMALIIQRPAGINQNYPTTEDSKVLDILNKTFGKSWKDCAFLFQNDGGISPETADKVMKQIMEKVNGWRAEDGKTVEVKRGDAMSAEYMQKELLPAVLSCMMERLPRFDDNLFSALQNDMRTLEEEFNQKCSELASAIKKSKGGIKLSGGSFRTHELVDEFKTKVLEKIKRHFLVSNESQKELTDRIFNAIDARTEKLRREFRNSYSANNEEQIEKFIVKKHKNEMVTDFVREEIQNFRIVISDCYSDLESCHQELIEDMQKFIYNAVHDATGALLPAEGNLDNIITCLEEVGDCDLTIQIFKNLRDLTAPFYTIIYPDLRSDVFHTGDSKTISNLVTPAEAFNKNDGDDRGCVINCMRYLNDIADEWTDKAQELLRGRIAIVGIIQAAVERFVDSMVRNDSAIDRELYAFMDMYLGQVSNNEDAWKKDVSAKIDKIVEILS